MKKFRNKTKKLSVEKELIDIGQKYNVKIIYDCGSKDALDGIELLNKLEGEELHIFECNPAAIQLCRDNINLYRGRGKIFLNKLAIKDREGEADFYSIDPRRTRTTHEDGNIGASSLFKPDPNYPKESYATNKIRVKTVTLDKYCQTHKIPDLLWMDLQGAELMALKGAKSILGSISIIHIEVSFRPIYIGQTMFWEIHRYLEKQFKLYKLYKILWPERFVRLYAGPLNKFIKFGHWFTNAIYINRRLL